MMIQLTFYIFTREYREQIFTHPVG